MHYPGVVDEFGKLVPSGPAYFYYGGVKVDLDSTAAALSLMTQALELSRSGRYELASVAKDGRRLEFLLGPGIPLIVRYPAELDD